MQRSSSFPGCLAFTAAVALLTFSTVDAKERAPHPRQAEIDSLFKVAADRLDTGDRQGAIPSLHEILNVDIRELPILAQAFMARGNFDRADTLFSTYLEKIDPAERAYYDDITFVGNEDEIKACAAIPSREKRQEFLRRVWMERDVTPAETVNRRLLEHYRRVWIARNRFGEKQTPWDRRGEVYIRYGEPDYRARSDEIDYIKSSDPRVQRLRERLALKLHGADFFKNNGDPPLFGPVYPLSGPAKPEGWPSPFSGRGTTLNFAGGTVFVPWESWIYFNIGGGIEITFTDERLSGRYDYAPFPDAGQLSTDLLVKLSNYSPSAIMQNTAATTPDYYYPDVAGLLTFGTCAAGFRGQEGKTRLEVYTGIPFSEVGYAQKDSVRVASLERRIALFDTTWREVLRTKDLLSFAASALSDTGAGAFIPGIQTFDLTPGDYYLAVQVTDKTSGRLQSYRQKFRVERFGQDSLQVSDIELAERIEPGAGADPFVKNGLRVLPMPSRAYRRDQNPFLYCEVYNLTPDAAGRTRYRVDYTIRSRDKRVEANVLSGLGRLIGKEQKKGEITISYEFSGTKPSDLLHAEFRAQDAKPGDHLLRISVTDLNTGAKTERETTFWTQK